VRCPGCGTELVIKFKYYSVLVLASLLGSLLLAHFQRLEGPIFVGGALLYAAGFLLVGLFLVVRVFPLTVEVDKHSATQLRL
jgi:hypothetical protein